MSRLPNPVPMQLEPARAKKSLDVTADWPDFPEGRYILEPKLDGDRRLLHVRNNGAYQALTGRRKSVKDNLFVDKSANLPLITTFDYGETELILDGEVIVPNGRSNDVTRIMGSTPLGEVDQKVLTRDVQYVVFDILYLDGQDLRSGIQAARRSTLKQWFIGNSHPPQMKLIDQFSIRGTAPKDRFDQIIQQGGEGLMIKDVFAPYGSGWIKAKKVSTFDVIIVGFTTGEGAYKELIGAIVFAVKDNGRLVTIGQCSGMSLEERTEFAQNKERYLGQVMEVAGQELTATHAIRHPRFIRLRPDKSPDDCTLQALKEANHE